MATRRRFIQQVGASCAAVSSLKGQQEQQNNLEKEAWPLLFFEKPVQNLSYEEIADELASMGASGIEATIRQGGHIQPENAAKEVPAMVKTLAAAGLHTIIAASNVLQADKKSRDHLKILRDSGITRYRSDYYRYSKNGDLMKEVAKFRDQARALADLNAELGMQAFYQNHSGPRFVGAQLWDAALIFEGIDPDHFAIAYDLRHGRTDSGLSWQKSSQLVREHMRAIYVKDARWEGERSDQTLNCPLDTGFINQRVFDQARQGQQPMPLSLHLEWGKHSLYPEETAREAWPLIRRDMEVLKKWRG